MNRVRVLGVGGGVAVGLLGLCLSGCGREVPEGYTKVTVRFGGESFRAPAPALGMMAVCSTPMPLYLIASGPGMPPLRKEVGLFGDTGAVNTGNTVGSFSVDLLVLKGSDRVFEMIGVAYDSCTFSSASVYPIYGKHGPVALSKPMEITMSGVASSAQFNVSGSACTPAASSPFVDQNFLGTSPGSNFVIKDVESGMVVYQSASFSCTSSCCIGPLIPGRKYQIKATILSVNHCKEFMADSSQTLDFSGLTTCSAN